MYCSCVLLGRVLFTKPITLPLSYKLSILYQSNHSTNRNLSCPVPRGLLLLNCTMSFQSLAEIAFQSLAVVAAAQEVAQQPAPKVFPQYRLILWLTSSSSPYQAARESTQREADLRYDAHLFYSYSKTNSRIGRRAWWKGQEQSREPAVIVMRGSKNSFSSVIATFINGFPSRMTVPAGTRSPYFSSIFPSNEYILGPSIVQYIPQIRTVPCHLKRH